MMGRRTCGHCKSFSKSYQSRTLNDKEEPTSKSLTTHWKKRQEGRKEGRKKGRREGRKGRREGGRKEGRKERRKGRNPDL